MPVSITKQIEVLESEATHIKSRIQRYRITLDDKQTKPDHAEYLESEITKQESRLTDNRTRTTRLLTVTESKVSQLRGENRKTAIISCIIVLLVVVFLHYLGYIDITLLFPADKFMKQQAGAPVSEEERRQQIRDLMMQQKEEEAMRMSKEYM
jgi:hypothetical protein